MSGQPQNKANRVPRDSRRKRNYSSEDVGHIGEWAKKTVYLFEPIYDAASPTQVRLKACVAKDTTTSAIAQMLIAAHLTGRAKITLGEKKSIYVLGLLNVMGVRLPRRRGMQPIYAHNPAVLFSEVTSLTAAIAALGARENLLLMITESKMALTPFCIGKIASVLKPSALQMAALIKQANTSFKSDIPAPWNDTRNQGLPYKTIGELLILGVPPAWVARETNGGRSFQLGNERATKLFDLLRITTGLKEIAFTAPPPRNGGQSNAAVDAIVQ